MIARTSHPQFPKSVHRLLIQRMAADHPKLESILKDVAVQVERHFFDSAGKRFAEFRNKHDRHMVVEEDVLFPVYESLTTDWETIAEMKQAHRLIRQLIDDAQSAISGWDGERFKKAYRDLLDALATHVMQEVVLLAEDLDSCLCAEEEPRPADGSLKLSS